MLVLTLSPDETLHIGDNITLCFERKADPILQKCGIPDHSKNIRVEINAPLEIPVFRYELLHPVDDYND